MCDRLIHRGPDEEGYYLNPSRTLCLGHRRLRIIDLATGRQPIANEDGSVTVTFNGEIYGFQPIRESLQSRGHHFQTHTDTEVIVHLYEEQGIDCLAELKGMFAFALWDERGETLYLARDRMGKKPLYYTMQQGILFFASELHALLAVPGLSREIDDVALDQYLTLGYVPAPRTIYQHIKKLVAGEYVRVHSGNLQQTQYWELHSMVQGTHSDKFRPEEAMEELVRRFRDATALRMISDVPLGCFLSGGVDSSTVLAFMAELSPRPVQTFSIGFPEESYSELKYARMMAEHFGTDHHEYVLMPDGASILDELVRHVGEPLADSSALPTWYLAQLTKKSVTVALTGDGGDELFGGYRWYQTVRALEALAHVPQWLVRMGTHLENSSLPWLGPVGKAAALLEASGGVRHATLRQVISPKVKGALYSDAFVSRTRNRALEWLGSRYDQIQADDPLNHAMAADLVTYLAEDLLVKVDRTSMAHALECRSPFLDTDLVEWVFSLPSAVKLSSRGSKWLLREAVHDRFPQGFLDRRKQAFDVPLEKWFRNDLRTLVKDRVLHGPLAALDVFDASGLKQVIEEHFTGQANYENIVWSLLVLATWLEGATS